MNSNNNNHINNKKILNNNKYIKNLNLHENEKNNNLKLKNNNVEIINIDDNDNDNNDDEIFQFNVQDWEDEEDAKLIQKEREEIKKEEELEERLKKRELEEFNKEKNDKMKARLNFLLDKTSLFAEFLSQKVITPSHSNIIKERENYENHKKRKCYNDEENKTKKKGKFESDSIPTTIPTKIMTIKQPNLITGGTMKHYQLQGTEWLISLYENGLNGILADEMGLGKTIQCIALFAHLIEQGVNGPFLVVAPLSTLSNWIDEIKKWTPTISCLKYHGTLQERSEIRKKEFKRNNKSFTIVITSFEVAIKDHKHLTKYKWKYIVVDEGHRLKNMKCKLVKQLKSYPSVNRLLLTGTPLQNNLSELWSMLNFLLPDIFDDLESFQRWFDFSSLQNGENEKLIAQEEEEKIITKLHHILRPFLLRRIKKDVELELPKKYEKIVYTNLSGLQTKLYMAILNNKLTEILSPSALKNLKNQGVSIQNILVQLRKCCNHPYLFEWPKNKYNEDIIDEELIRNSGKLQIMDRLLFKLKQDKHKVLIFSQMTRMLDILEDYVNFRKFTYCRIDGSTSQLEREEKIQHFNKDPNIFCFLLSTRAGGLGINLTSADTVIFYDNDWNPQMDLQAQDRCHRIGQTKIVRIYRLCTANSIESKILQKQESKKKLERLVIQKGNFTGVKSKSILEIEELKELLSNESIKDIGQAEKLTDDDLFCFNN